MVRSVGGVGVGVGGVGVGGVGEVGVGSSMGVGVGESSWIGTDSSAKISECVVGFFCLCCLRFVWIIAGSGIVNSPPRESRWVTFPRESTHSTRVHIRVSWFSLPPVVFVCLSMGVG